MTFLYLLLAFVLGMAVTWFWAVRTVHRDVPTAALAGIWGDRDGATAVESVRRARTEQRAPRGTRRDDRFDDDDDAEFYDQELDADD